MKNTMNDYKIILDKERTLRYSNRSFMELEKRMEKSVLSLFTDMGTATNGDTPQKMLMAQFSSAKFISDFIYCGLLHDPEMDSEKVIDIIPVSKYTEIMLTAINILTTEFGLTTNGKAAVAVKADKKKAA